MGSGGHPKLLPRKLGRLMHVHPINVIVVVGARRASRVEVLHPIARWLQAWYNESFTYFESFTGYNTYAHYKLDRISYQRCNPVTTEYIYHVFFSMIVATQWIDYVSSACAFAMPNRGPGIALWRAKVLDLRAGTRGVTKAWRRFWLSSSPSRWCKNIFIESRLRSIHVMTFACPLLMLPP